MDKRGFLTSTLKRKKPTDLKLTWCFDPLRVESFMEAVDSDKQRHTIIYMVDRKRGVAVEDTIEEVVESIRSVFSEQ